MSAAPRRAALLGAALAAGLLAAGARADEAAIRKALEPLLGAARIESVRPAPLAGLFEVQLDTAGGAQIVYTDARGTYIVQGNIYDPRSGRDLTEQRLRQLAAVKFESLPLDQAVRIRRGNGKRVLALFSDPYCPACRQFESALQEVDNLTVHVFMIPVIRPDLADHSRVVWCSPDRARAWLDLALRGKRPNAKPGCADPVDKNLALAQTLRIRATPTLIFADGERLDGGPPLEELQKRLDQAAKQR